MKIKSKLKKYLVLISLLSVLVQSTGLPFYWVPKAIADETTPPSSTDSSITSSTPTDTVTPTPTVDQTTPTDTITPVPTDVPTDTVTPAPADTVTPIDTQPVDNLSPPASDDPSTGGQSQSSNLSPVPTITGSSNTTSDTSEKGNLSAVILENVSAPSLDLQAPTSQGSATLTTDKADYAPTDLVIISGTNFDKNQDYILVIFSDDPPALNFQTDIKTDENGSFTYAYQLDGNYRPNYKAELKDSTGTVVATTTFTDSLVIGCTNDAQGANDEPGQKDLTKMCVNSSNSTDLGISWNWDDTSFSGNNTGDACSLYDTNNDGLADYALCVGVNGNPASNVYTTLYSCGNGSSEKCTQPILQINSFSSTCSASVVSGSNPFDLGSDTVANCSVSLSDVGGGSTNLLDVCSFPSGQPNSDPSDCIVASTAAQTGTLTVTKVLSPSGDSGLFNLNIDSNTFATDIGNNGTTGPKVVDTGTHTVSESAGTNTSLSNYSSGVVCRDNSNNNIIVQGSGTSLQVTIANNQNVTCAITNTRINNASITIVKDAVPNDAQDFAFTTTGSGLSSFSLDDDSDPTLSNTKAFSNLAAGTYSVSEGAVSGWTQTSATCSDGSPVSAISLQAGENVTCTFTNTKDAKLTVHKVVTNHGGSKTTADFAPYKVDSTTVTLDTPTVFGIGSHTVTETPDANYTATFSGACDTNGSVTLAAGDNKTCTITNEEKQSKVVIHKIVINHGLTNDATHFAPYKVGSTTVTLDAETVMNSGNYVVSEAADSNYTASFTAGDCDANGNITLTPGTTKTCTITNEEKPATIVVHKVVINHGLTNNASHFALYKVGDTTVTLDAVTNINSGTYTVSELTDSNYTATFSGDCNAQGQLVVTPDSAKSCTITNEEASTHLKLTKVVKNHGGTKIVSDFPLFIDGNSVTSGDNNLVNSGAHTVSETGDSNYAATISGDCNAQGNVTLTSGANGSCIITNEEKLSDITVHKTVINHGGSKVAADFGPYKVDSTTVTLDQATTFDSGSHTVAETPSSSYTATFSGDCDANGVITLGSGQHKTCTITNEEKPAKLIVTKVVNGGTKQVSDFPLFVDQTGVTSGATNTFDSGLHVVSETNQSGYSGVFSGNCDANGNVTLVAGQTKSCTITNTRDTGDLKVVKVVDDRSSLTQWSFTLDGGAPISADANGNVDFGQVTTLDSHTITESGPNGYHLVSVTGTNCTDNQDATATATVDKDGTTTCTFTNNINKGTITVHKDIIGTETDLTQFCFTLNPDPEIGQICADENGDAVFNDVPFGTYSADETSSAPDYTEQSNDCTDLAVINDGDPASCTVTNSRDQGTITVVKSLSPSDDPGLFNLQINDNTVGTGENVGDQETTGQITVDTGDYTVGETAGTETDLSDYTTSISCVDEGGEGEEIASTGGNGTSLSDIQVNKGDDIVCTITNTRDTETVVIHKLVDNDASGDYETSDSGANTIGFRWGLDEGVTNRLMGTSETITTGEKHNVNENSIPGYVFTGWFENLGERTVFNCENPESTSTNISFTVTKDNERSFTLCNQLQNPILTISKTNDAIGDQGPGNDVLYTITIAATQSSAQNVTVTDLLPDGFKYKGGSWTATSNVNPGLVVPEPIYASPGVWSLGNMVAGETITLTLVATIDSGQQQGIYKDVAWAQGTSLASSTVLAQAQNPGFVDTNFVGTQVNVIKEDSQAPSLVKGEVLGASTLPATGEDTIWVIIATLLLGMGAGSLLVGFKLKKKYVE